MARGRSAICSLTHRDRLRGSAANRQTDAKPEEFGLRRGRFLIAATLSVAGIAMTTLPLPAVLGTLTAAGAFAV
jgi:hypothetical protein